MTRRQPFPIPPDPENPRRPSRQGKRWRAKDNRRLAETGAFCLCTAKAGDNQARPGAPFLKPPDTMGGGETRGASWKDDIIYVQDS
jgi:hypothetical protein